MATIEDYLQLDGFVNHPRNHIGRVQNNNALHTLLRSQLLAFASAFGNPRTLDAVERLDLSHLWGREVRKNTQLRWYTYSRRRGFARFFCYKTGFLFDRKTGFHKQFATILFSVPRRALYNHRCN